MNPSPNVLVWVTSLLGSGHFKRAAVLAEALADRGFAVMLLNGGPPPLGPSLRNVEVRQLPSIRAADVEFSHYLTEENEPADEHYLAERQQRLWEIYREFSPDVLITEMFPFGRRQLGSELLPVLDDCLHREKTMVVGSVRDILVTGSKPTRIEFSRDIALKYYDLILIHGDPRICGFADTFPLATDLNGLIAYTGYVCPQSRVNGARARSGVLVSAGSGVVGAKLLDTAISAARRFASEGEKWTIVTGPRFSGAQRSELRANLPDNCALHEHVDNLPQLMAQHRASISQAGYNTVTEGIMTDTPMILIPFADGRENEQTTRAQILADRNLAIRIPENALSVDSLHAALEDLPALRPTSGVRIQGAKVSARILEKAVCRPAVT